MEFPKDIWSEILRFLSPLYITPTHFKAIMGTDVFRYHRYINKSARIQSNIDSFYMHIVSSSWWYWKFPDIQPLLVTPEVVICRGVATGHIREDFIKIYNEYAKQHTHSLNHIHYEI